MVDIKPYLPYADIIPEASGGFTTQQPPLVDVQFSPKALQQCETYEAQTGRSLQTLIREILAQDPRPSYLGQLVRGRLERAIRLAGQAGVVSTATLTTSA